MKNFAGYVEAREREARRAKLDLRVEICGILLFLPGLGLLVTLVVLLNTVVMMRILPEEAQLVDGTSLLAPFQVEWMHVVVSVLVFVIPAGLFMSAGVVLRYFLLRD